MSAPFAGARIVIPFGASSHEVPPVGDPTQFQNLRPNLTIAVQTGCSQPVHYSHYDELSHSSGDRPLRRDEIRNGVAIAGPAASISRGCCPRTPPKLNSIVRN